MVNTEEYGKDIAIIGASSDRSRYSNKAVRAYISHGYKVYPVNPNESSVEGLKCYQKVSDIPDKVDLASVYLNPATSLSIRLPAQLKAKGIKRAILNPGAANDELVRKLKALDIEVQMICSIAAIGLDPAVF